MIRLMTLWVLLGAAVFAQSGWVMQNVPARGKTVADIHSPAPGVVIAVGDSGLITRTSDGGAVWNRVASGVNVDLYSVSFGDGNRGWITGDEGTILATTDDGRSWSPQTSGTSLPLLAVHFVDENTGWVMAPDWFAPDETIILKTTNGGRLWISSVTDTWLSSFHFSDQQFGWGVGWIGEIRKTTNGGGSWNTLNSGTLNSLESVHFIDRMTGWCAGEAGTILHTTNGGAGWMRQNSGTSKDLWSICFADGDNGWAVGEGGAIIRTTNGGITWTEQRSGTTETLWSVHFSSANTGYAVGAGGIVLKTVTGGDVTGIREQHSGGERPGSLSLRVYPNPFAASANVRYSLARSGRVEIALYDLLGRGIRTLLSDWMDPGEYDILLPSERLPAGVYILRLRAGDEVRSRTVLRLR